MRYKKGIQKKYSFLKWRRIITLGLVLALMLSGTSTLLTVYGEQESGEIGSVEGVENDEEQFLDEDDSKEESENIDSNENDEEINNGETSDAETEEAFVREFSTLFSTTIPIATEEDFWNALSSMSNGQSITLELKSEIRLTKSLQIEQSGTYNVTIIGNGENTKVFSDESIRLFSVKNGNVNITLDNVILDGQGKASGFSITDGARLTLVDQNGSVIRNMRDTNGAAIQVANGTIDVQGMTLQDNQATNNGGAIYSYNGTITAINSTFTENYAGNDGGALYHYEAGVNINVTGSTFSNNNADNAGGAVAIASGGLNSYSTIFSGNQANIGGAIFMRSGVKNSQLRVASNSVIESNKSVSSGGGIHVESAPLGVFIEDSTIKGNTSENGNGGGAYLHSSGNIHLNRSTISKNRARNGAGMFIFNTNTITAVGNQILSNVATDSGGGIYTSVTSSISTTTFDNNQATNGGGVYKAGTTAKLIFNSAIFSNNKAALHGGAIGLDFNAWSNITCGFSKFIGNSASYSVETLTPEAKTVHDSIMMVNYSYGTKEFTAPFTHGLNNYDVWNTGTSAELEFDPNAEEYNDQVENMPVDEEEYARGAKVLLPLEMPYLEGFNFLGWATNADATVPEYILNPEASTKEEQDLWYTVTGEDDILYAVWERQDVSVTYDVNGGTFVDTTESTITEQIHYGGTITEMPLPQQRYGYEFIGWYQTNAGEDLEYALPAERDDAWGPSWNIDTELEESITLYARWKQVPFQIGDDVFGNQYEQLIRQAIDSQREIINMHLYADITISDAMRVSQALTDTITINFISTKSDGSAAHLTQAGEERHFYVRLANTEIKINLDNIIVDSSSGYGGIEVSKGTLTVIGKNKAEISNVTSYSSGGAFLIKDSATVKLTNITLSDHQVTTYGGAISASGANTKVDLTNVTIDNNKAQFGGGIEVSNGANLTINDSTISNNHVSQVGGGIYVSDDTVSVRGSNNSISENKADVHGGGIGIGALRDDGKDVLKSIELSAEWSNNSATNYVDVITDEHKELYDTIIDVNDIENLWNGHNVSYLYNIYTVKYDVEDVKDVLVSEPVDARRYGETYILNLPVLEILDTVNEAPWMYRSFDDWVDDKYAYEERDAEDKIKWTFSGNETNILLYPTWNHETVEVVFEVNPSTTEKYMPKVLEQYADNQPILSDSDTILTITVEKGTTILPPDEDVIEHADEHLHYWYNTVDGVPFDFDESITEDTTLAIEWGPIALNEAMITFHMDGGEPYIAPMIVDASMMSLTDAEYAKLHSITKEGYDFEGWYFTSDFVNGTKLEQTDFTLNQGQNNDLYAKWEIKEFTIETATLPTEGGVIKITLNNSDVSNQTEFDYGTNITIKAIPNTGYDFTGWSVDDASALLLRPADELDWTVTQDIKMIAHFRLQNHVVTYRDLDTDRVLLTFAVPHGDELENYELPPIPNGYKVSSWSDGDVELQNFPENIIVTENMTFYRKLEKESYTVEFYSDISGTWESIDELKQEVEYDERVSTINDLSRDYYDFDCWSTDPDSRIPWNIDSETVRHDMKLYACWTPKDTPPPVVISIEIAEDTDLDFDNPGSLDIMAGEYIQFPVVAEPEIPDPIDESRDVLTYRWVICDINGNPIRVLSESESQSYLANFGVQGTVYCYLEVTNTNTYYSGSKATTIRSGILTINVARAPFMASPPVILDNPHDMTVEVGEDASFTVVAISPDARMAIGYDVELTYQWFENTESGPVKIEGATSETYQFTTDTVGEFQYFVEVTNTLYDQDYNVYSSERVTSDSALLTVYEIDIPDVYSVIYSANEADGGYPPMDTNKYEAGEEVTILENTGNLTRVGYTFMGWCLDKDGDGETLVAGDKVVMGDENIHLYAKWQKIPSEKDNDNNTTLALSNQKSKTSTGDTNTIEVYIMGILLASLAGMIFIGLPKYRKRRQ